MSHLMKTIFKLDDYKKFNKDLQFETDEEYIEHWLNIGYKQRRLCHIRLLYASNEFGIEILFHVGYYYYLFQNNLLFDNQISTYTGMEAYYYFVPKEQLIFRNEKRMWIAPSSYMLTNYLNIVNHQLNLEYWRIPRYKEYYTNQYFLHDKEILIIHNKYNKEWGEPPINYIPVDVLYTILTLLNPIYQIIYIRPNNYLDTKLHYSYDHNDNVDYNDYEMIRSTFKDVIIFDDLFQQDIFSNMNYNLLKCYLFASCNKYISVQGGANNLIFYFAKDVVLYHKKGFEIEKGIYKTRSKLQSLTNDIRITHTDNYNDFIDIIKKTYL